MHVLRYCIAAAASVSLLHLSRYASRNQHRKGLVGTLFKILAKIPSAAAPILGAAAVVALERLSEQRQPATAPEDIELERLRNRLQLLAAVNPDYAQKATERTKLDLRLKSIGFEELPSSELDLIFDAVNNQSDVEADTDYQQLELAKQQLDAVMPEGATEEDKQAAVWELSEAQELYKILKALNGMAAEMEGAKHGTSTAAAAINPVSSQNGDTSVDAADTGAESRHNPTVAAQLPAS